MLSQANRVSVTSVIFMVASVVGLLDTAYYSKGFTTHAEYNQRNKDRKRAKRK